MKEENNNIVSASSAQTDTVSLMKDGEIEMC